MPTFEHERKKIQVDEEGYLVNFEDWDETVACALAEREGVGKECPLVNVPMCINPRSANTFNFPIP